MFDAMELLRFRRTATWTPTLLQICWCAATKRNFVDHNDTLYKATPQEVESVDFIQLRSDIENVLFNEESTVRFNLFVGSQLMYGALRIFNYQTLTLEEKTEAAIKTLIEFDCVVFQKGKKKNPKLLEEKETKNNLSVDEQTSFPIQDIEDVDIQKLFRGDENRRDEHIIEEIDQFLKAESSSNFGSSQTYSDVDKVMEELYEEMQRNDVRSRRSTRGKQKSNHNEILRQAVVRTPERFPRRSSESPSESARTPLTPPSTQRSKSQLQISMLEGVSQTEHHFDTPIMESEILPEAAMPDEPMLSRSSIAAATTFATPSLPAINATIDSVEPMDIKIPEENFPVIQEGVGKVNIDINIEGTLKSKLVIDQEKQIEITDVSTDVYTRKSKDNIIRKLDKKKITPARALFILPATNWAFGCKKSRTWSSRCLVDKFASILISRYRTLKTPRVPIHSVTEEAPEVMNRTEEEEIQHSPAKIMRTEESTAMQNLITDHDPETLPEATTAPEGVEVENPPDDLDPPSRVPGRGQLDNVEFGASSQPEDNICGDAGIKNRLRKKSNSCSDDSREEEPASKKLKVQERDADAESKSKISRAKIYEKIKSFWNSMRSSKVRKSKDAVAKLDFQEIIHPDKCNTTDVINSLIQCFELEKEGKVLIQQQKPYDPVFLVKPSR